MWVQRGLSKPNSKVLIPQIIMLINMMVHVGLWCSFGYTYDSNYGDVCNGVFAAQTGEQVGGEGSTYMPLTASFFGTYSKVLLITGIVFCIAAFVDLTLLCKVAACVSRKG
jgi:hypothetical protein